MNAFRLWSYDKEKPWCMQSCIHERNNIIKIQIII